MGQRSFKRLIQSGTKRVLTFALLVTGLACTEKVDWDLKYEQENLIVVEGKITNEIKSHEVKITFPVYEMNGIPEPVTGAIVQINDGRVIFPLREDPQRPGIYRTAPDFAAVVNKYYQLNIRYGDRLITALTNSRPVSDFQNMRPYPVQNSPRLYQVYISDGDAPAIVRMEMDWSHVAGYDTLPDQDNHALIYHYTLNGVDVNRFFSPDQEQVKFPPGTIVFREKESVSSTYGDFLRGILSETDWRGGVFDVLPGNASTNMTEGAIGYFTSAMIIRDTVLID